MGDVQAKEMRRWVKRVVACQGQETELRGSLKLELREQRRHLSKQHTALKERKEHGTETCRSVLKMFLCVRDMF